MKCEYGSDDHTITKYGRHLKFGDKRIIFTEGYDMKAMENDYKAHVRVTDGENLLYVITVEDDNIKFLLDGKEVESFDYDIIDYVKKYRKNIKFFYHEDIGFGHLVLLNEIGFEDWILTYPETSHKQLRDGYDSTN